MTILELWQTINQDVFIIAALLLLLGFMFGWLVKFFKFPRVTGYIIAGILFGPSFLKLLSESALTRFDFVPQLALGIIALTIGAGLSFSLIRKLGMSVILITVLQALGAFFLVLFLLFLFKMPLIAALPLAAVATATDPAATIAVIKEYRARGSLTESTLAVVALDDAVAIVLFGLVLAFDLRHLATFGETALQSLSASMLEVLGALVIGLVLGLLAHLLIKMTREISDTLIITLAMVLLAIGIATYSHTSALLTNMFLGLTIINLSSRNSEIVDNLGKTMPPIYCIFFVLSGAQLNLRVFATGGTTLLLWGGIFVLSRMLGKVGGAYLGGQLSGAKPAIKKYLGWTLIPQGGLAVGLPLMVTAASPYFQFRPQILNLTLLAIAFNNIVGPICTKTALFRAREATTEE